MGKRGRPPKKALTVAQILAWADAHHQQTGQWPTKMSGAVRGEQPETWGAVNAALRYARGGLPGGDTLHKLLRRAGRIGERRGWPPTADRQTILALRAEGLTLAQIGHRLDVSYQTVRNLLRRVPDTGKSQPKREGRWASSAGHPSRP